MAARNTREIRRSRRSCARGAGNSRARAGEVRCESIECDAPIYATRQPENDSVQMSRGSRAVYPRRRRVAAARLAACDLRRGPLVAAACTAARERSPALRRWAAPEACRDSDAREAALVPSFCRARSVARLRRGEGARGLRRPWPVWYASSADRRVLAWVRPGAGGFSGTPARRALDSPMAIACLVERAPCLPCRM